jgi:glycosyltransferase involved in cell wall biosynthesis
MNRKPRLLMIASTFPRGRDDTTPAFILHLAQQLTRDWQVHVLAPFAHGAAREEDWPVPDAADRVVHVHRFRYWLSARRLVSDGAMLANVQQRPGLWLQVPTFMLAMVFAIRRLHRRFRFRTWQAHWIIPQGLAARLACFGLRRHRPRLVMTAHGTDIYGLKRFDRLKRRICAKADLVTAVSPALAEQLRQIGLPGEVPVEVAPMGTDTRRFADATPDARLLQRSTPRLLFVGRLSEQKGIDVLIDAFKAIAGDFPTATLTIVGEGEQRRPLESRAAGCDAIQFLGGVPHAQVPGLMAAADVFVSPSNSEGFGLVFVEAMAAGCLTIGSTLPAIRSLIEHGKTGYLVPPADVDALATLLRQVLGRLDDLIDIRRAGQQAAISRYDWTQVRDRYSALLRGDDPSALSNSARRRRS